MKNEDYVHIENVLKHFVESVDFKDKVVAYTRKTIRDLTVIIVPLILIITGLSVYIFETTNNNIERLILIVEKQTQENRQLINDFYKKYN